MTHDLPCRPSARRVAAFAASALALAALAGCTGRLDVPGVAAPPAAGGVPFEPLATAAALGKVKTLLTGLPPTDAELAAVAADPAALRGLVDQWTRTPQWTAKLRAFFGAAFQQSQTTADEFQDQLGATALQRLDARLLANLRESFGRTAAQLVADGRPFTEVLTTRRFQLTPRLMALYAFADALAISDSSTTIDLFAKANPGFSFTLTAQRTVPLDRTLDPQSPDFMVWTAPQLAKVYDPLCPQDPLVYDGRKGQNPLATSLYLVLQGGVPQFTVSVSSTGGGTVNHTCGPPAFPATGTALTVADTQQWQWVTVRPPAAGEATTRLYDLAGFRAGHDLVLLTPRLGFFTTPSFFAGWNTNSSNQARVTLNQTLIVALNHGLTPANATTPPNLAAVESIHAAPGTDCYACHQSLDPLRQYFRQQFTFAFHPQTNAAPAALPASFGFRGVTADGGGLVGMAARLATHPDFATGWTQKLCTWANSAPCLESDPEFVRVAGRFAAGFDFAGLVVDLFSSPLVTFLAETASADQRGQIAPVARRDHLCAALSNRLGVADVCGLDVNTPVPAALQPVQLIASVLPSDQYSRGAEQPVLAADPSLFFRAGVENLCAALAGRLIDGGAAGRWTSASSTAALADFVHLLMGVGPAGGRDAVPLQILTDHVAAARAAGLKASDALRSAFVLACESPSVVGIGQGGAP